MFFCQGFVHAQDRFWQMEMNRRIGWGKLSEAFGKDALNTDRLTRTLGFNRLAQADQELLTSEYHEYLEAYSAGVNGWLQNNKLPIEFALTRIVPEPWTILDTLAWGRVMTWTLSHGWSGALTRQAIIDKVGTEMAGELSILYPEGNPFEIPLGIDVNHLEMDEMVESGKVVRFPGKIVTASGNEVEQDITRIGVFNAISAGRFLRALPESGILMEPGRQPGQRFLDMAQEIESADTGIHPFPIDPTRGAMLALLVQVPDLKNRVEQGGLIGYVILVIGIPWFYSDKFE